MKHKTISKDEIKIIGIELKTTNENGQAVKDIPKFWQKFYSENLKNQIPNKIDEEIFGLYIDYEKDFTKPYSFIIGCKVSSLDKIPQNMVSKTIPASKYEVFTVKGKFPDELLKTWQYIWSSDLKRTYTGDFEVYGKRFFNNPQNPEIDVYIAIK